MKHKINFVSKFELMYRNISWLVVYNSEGKVALIASQIVHNNQKLMRILYI